MPRASWSGGANSGDLWSLAPHNGPAAPDAEDSVLNGHPRADDEVEPVKKPAA
jgi:hypothetical protein